MILIRIDTGNGVYKAGKRVRFKLPNIIRYKNKVIVDWFGVLFVWEKR